MKYVHLDNCPVCGSAEIYVLKYLSDTLVNDASFPLSQCRVCGFVLTQAFPAQEYIGQYYASENYTSHHDAKGLFGFFYRLVRCIMLRKKAALVKKYAPRKGKLLDIGCGQGHFLNKIQRKGFEVFGIEKDEKICKLARQKFGIEPKTPEWLKEQANESFEAITMWHSLEHIENLNKTMDAVHRLLTQDGVLVVALPNVNSYDQKRYQFDWAGYDVPRHLWHFSPKTFNLLAEKHGFKIKKRKPMRFDVFYISILSEKAKRLKYATLRGLIFGFLAYKETLLKPKKASSIMYVLKKKQ